MRHKESGFTLIELVLTVMLMGILSVIVVPHLNTGDFQGQFVLDDVASTLQFARNRAVASGCAVRVAQNDTTQLLELYYYVPCNGGSNQPPELIVSPGQGNTSTNSELPAGVQLAVSPSVFYFDALGQVYQESPQGSTTVTITLSLVGGTTQSTLTVNPSGFVS